MRSEIEEEQSQITNGWLPRVNALALTLTLALCPGTKQSRGWGRLGAKDCLSFLSGHLHNRLSRQSNNLILEGPLSWQTAN